MTQDPPEALVEGIYEAALVPSRWPPILEGIARAVGAASSNALWFDGEGTRLLHAEGWNVDPEHLDLYARHYVGICPRLRLSRGLRAGTAFDDQAVRAAPSASDREYYAFTDPRGYGEAVSLLAERALDHVFGLNFCGPRQDVERHGDRRLLAALAPHLRRAGHMTLRIREVVVRAELADAVAGLGPATLLIGPGGVVRQLNRRAEAILAKGDGLRLLAGRLHAMRPDDDARLQREIGTALETRTLHRDAGEGFALVARPSGLAAWAVSALPIPLRLGARAQALVTVVETMPRVSPARLRQGFGLSQAEAEVAAALAHGHGLDAIAERRGASLGTVRAQVKAIFAKLDVSTQAQLVGRVASLCGLPSPPP